MPTEGAAGFTEIDQAIAAGVTPTGEGGAYTEADLQQAGITAPTPTFTPTPIAPTPTPTPIPTPTPTPAVNVKDLTAVAPEYAKQHPEDVVKIGNYYYRAPISASEAEAGVTSTEKLKQIISGEITPAGAPKNPEEYKVFKQLVGEGWYYDPSVKYADIKAARETAQKIVTVQAQQNEAQALADALMVERSKLLGYSSKEIKGGYEAGYMTDWADRVAKLSPEDTAKFQDLLSQEATLRQEQGTAANWVAAASGQVKLSPELLQASEALAAMKEMRPYLKPNVPGLTTEGFTLDIGTLASDISKGKTSLAALTPALTTLGVKTGDISKAVNQMEAIKAIDAVKGAKQADGSYDLVKLLDAGVASSTLLAAGFAEKDIKGAQAQLYGAQELARWTTGAVPVTAAEATKPVPYEEFAAKYFEERGWGTVERAKAYTHGGVFPWAPKTVEAAEHLKEAEEAYAKQFGKGALLQSAGAAIASTFFMPARALAPGEQKIAGWEWGVGGAQLALLAAPIWAPKIPGLGAPKTPTLEYGKLTETGFPAERTVKVPVEYVAEKPLALEEITGLPTRGYQPIRSIPIYGEMGETTRLITPAYALRPTLWEIAGGARVPAEAISGEAMSIPIEPPWSPWRIIGTGRIPTGTPLAPIAGGGVATAVKPSTATMTPEQLARLMGESWQAEPVYIWYEATEAGLVPRWSPVPIPAAIPAVKVNPAEVTAPIEVPVVIPTVAPTVVSSPALTIVPLTIPEIIGSLAPAPAPAPSPAPAPAPTATLIPTPVTPVTYVPPPETPPPRKKVPPPPIPLPGGGLPGMAGGYPAYGKGYPTYIKKVMEIPEMYVALPTVKYTTAPAGTTVEKHGTHSYYLARAKEVAETALTLDEAMARKPAELDARLWRKFLHDAQGVEIVSPEKELVMTPFGLKEVSVVTERVRLKGGAKQTPIGTFSAETFKPKVSKKMAKAQARKLFGYGGYENQPEIQALSESVGM